MDKLAPTAVRLPVWRNWSAARTLTKSQGVVILAGSVVLLGLIGALGPRVVLAVVIALLTGVFLLTSAVKVGYFVVGFRHARATASAESSTWLLPHDSVPARSDGRLPTYTVLVALYHEANVVPALLQALAELEYPSDRMQVLLLVEADDPETRMACERDCRSGWEVVVVPEGIPRTKPRALNHGLTRASGELLTIYDAEDRPDPRQLLTAAQEFAHRGPRVAALQARLGFYNSRENLLTSWFSCDYAAHFGLYLQAVSALGHPLPLGGTSTHFRTEIIRSVGGWDAWNVTEDCELGMRLSAASYEAHTLDSITMEEAVSGVPAWVKQRTRWIKGFIQTTLVMLRQPLRTGRAMGWRRFAAALIATGGVPLVFCLQPLFWALLVIYFSLRSAGVDVRSIEALFPEPLLSLAVVSLVFGNFAIVLGHMCALYQQGRFDLVRYALFLPAYWLLGSIAAWRAVAQIVRSPHVWEKTAHGVGMVGSSQPPAGPGRVVASELALEAPAYGRDAGVD